MISCKANSQSTDRIPIKQISYLDLQINWISKAFKLEFECHGFSIWQCNSLISFWHFKLRTRLPCSNIDPTHQDSAEYSQQSLRHAWFLVLCFASTVAQNLTFEPTKTWFFVFKLLLLLSYILLDLYSDITTIYTPLSLVYSTSEFLLTLWTLTTYVIVTIL